MSADRYVVKTHLEHTEPGRWMYSGYWIVDTTGAGGAVWEQHRVDAQARADRWNRNDRKAAVAVSGQEG